MVKLEWGAKRTCQECNTRFYDLRRSPISCPKCGSIFEIQTSTRSRRGKNTNDLLKESSLRLEEVVLDEDIDLDDSLEATIEEDNTLIEDPSDLGEDLDDIPDVLEHENEEN